MSHELSDNLRRAYNYKMLEVLKYFIAFCHKKQLVYWAGYGTAIGAVRHHSIIPWDDDIDILMPRESYNRLLELSEEFNNERFEILHVKLSPDSICRAIHICDKNTTVINTIKLPIVNGVHIGISPIDFSDDSEEDITKHARETYIAFKDYFNCLRRYSINDVLHNVIHPRNLLYILKSMFHSKYAKETFKYKALSLDNYYVGNNGAKAFNVHELLFSKNIHVFKSDWFSGFVKMPFEDIQINLPNGYHEYLTLQYGDYMTPPPIDQQKPHHVVDYFNLCEKLSIENALERYRKGVRYEY